MATVTLHAMKIYPRWGIFFVVVSAFIWAPLFICTH